MKVKQLPSGNYRVQVVAGYDENGKRIVKSFTANEEWKVLKMASDFVNKRDSAIHSDVTLQTATEMYISSRSNSLEATTVRDYNQIVKHRFKGLMDTKISELKSIQIQQAINAEVKEVSPKTVKNAYGLLKSVLKMFDVDINLNNINLPKIKKKDKTLPPFETVFSIVKGTEIELPVLLSAWLSLRIGEVIGLKFKDIDYDNHIIHIRRTIILTDNGLKLREGCKTEDSIRDLEIPNYIFNLIEEIPHESREDFIVPLTRNALYSRFKRRLNKHNIDMTFHDLRSLNASIMIVLNIPDRYACERGGWSTDNILKSVYQRTFSTERKRLTVLLTVILMVLFSVTLTRK